MRPKLLITGGLGTIGLATANIRSFCSFSKDFFERFYFRTLPKNVPGMTSSYNYIIFMILGPNVAAFGSNFVTSAAVIKTTDFPSCSALSTISKAISFFTFQLLALAQSLSIIIKVNQK